MVFLLLVSVEQTRVGRSLGVVESSDDLHRPTRRRRRRRRRLRRRGSLLLVAEGLGGHPIEEEAAADAAQRPDGQRGCRRMLAGQQVVVNCHGRGSSVGKAS